jgi:transposase
MNKITTVGIDLAKQVMAVCGMDAEGRVVMRKVLRRDQLLRFTAALPSCVMAMEACGGAHHWARALVQQGHTARMIAAEFVQAVRKSGKNDANDAEAICTAARQPTMRFEAMKSVEQQAALCVHRLRQGLVEERTMVINRLRGLLTEFGVVAPLSPEKLRHELARCQDPEDTRLPATVRQLVGDQVIALDQLDARLMSFAAMIATQAQESETAQRLQTIAGVGPTTAAAMVATVGDANDFRNGRQFAAWLGLTPRQHSTGGKTRLGRITKRGDTYLRMLLILGARSTLQSALRKPPEARHRLQ